MTCPPSRCVAVLACLFAFGAALSAQTYDRYGRRVVPVPGEVPLLAGPPNPGDWRMARRLGQDLPLAVDFGLLYSSPTTFRILVPRVGRAGNDLEVVAYEVRNDGGLVDPASLRQFPGAGRSVSLTGRVRGSTSGLVILSVFGGVFYGRVIVGEEEAWTLYSSAGGQTYVRLSTPAPDAPDVPLLLLTPGDPSTPPRQPVR